MISFCKYETDQGTMVAACDVSLLGQTVEDSETEIRIEVSEEFYSGEEKDSQGVVESLRSASIANLVGEESVEAGIEAGVIDDENVIYIDGVAHAQMVRV
ncbi:MAG: DUF424 family protein [Halobacteria archaeon]|nr:DUF424 family protein [Halobacteria archaeon]